MLIRMHIDAKDWSRLLGVRKAAGVTLGRLRVLAPVVAELIRVERADGRTLQAIADGLNRDGLSTPTGRVWSSAVAAWSPAYEAANDEAEGDLRVNRGYYRSELVQRSTARCCRYLRLRPV